MLMAIELQLLHNLARHYVRGDGVIIDAGCFLGGSTQALASGLLENPRIDPRLRQGMIHSYDLFEVEQWTVGLYFPGDTQPNTSFEDLFRRNVARYASLLTVHPGDVMKASVPEAPIELMFLDLAKHWTVNDDVARRFFPRLLPERGILIQQDFLYPQWSGWLPITMEVLAPYFEKVDDTGRNSVVFRVRERVPIQAVKTDVVGSRTMAELRDLGDRAVARFSGEQKVIVRQSVDHFLSLAGAESWPR
jgi:hypothetical protein